MAKIDPFEKHLDLYEDWFVVNHYVYVSELKAIRYLLPQEGDGVEIGVGSGIFAAPLGIKTGVDPSPRMTEKARERNIVVTEGIAEKLPFQDQSFDYALMVTTICFVDDVQKSLRETARILKNKGVFVLAFVDKDSPVGREYLRMKEKSLFYKEATFFSTNELKETLTASGLVTEDIVQTVFGQIDEVKTVQDVKPGYGEGSFVVIRSVKKHRIERSERRESTREAQ